MKSIFLKKQIKQMMMFFCLVILLIQTNTGLATSLTTDQLIQQAQQQSGARVISLSAYNSHKKTAELRLLYPDGTVKQQQINTQTGQLIAPSPKKQATNR